MRKKGTLWVGTSNVTLPGSRVTFPPAFQSTSRLHYYSHLFNSVEINSSFHKTPMLSTYQKWALDVPEDFQFSIKYTKEITHVKKLDFDVASSVKFMQTAEGLGNKKGCLLIQFPGSITLDYFNKVEEILQEIDGECDPQDHWRKAIEFRHPSWYTGETYELLDQHQAVIVLHDFKKAKISEIPRKQKFVYLRFHGPKGDYRDSYDDGHLRSKATQIKQWLKEGKDVYAYFNNTMGKAFENAVSLVTMVGTN